MKKTLLKILTAVAAALMPWPLAAVNTIIHTAYYNGNSTIGTDTIGGGTYATVHYDGLYNGGTPGTPSLPIDYIRFSVPYNATNFTVTAQPKNTYSSRLNYPIYPCQEPRMMSDTTPVVITLPDSAAYYSGSDYPTQRAWVVDEGFLAGENHVVTVAVMPIAYKYSATGLYRHTLKESHSVRLTLSYSLSDSLAMYPIVRNDSTLRQEGYALTQRMVANPSNVIANAPIEMTMDSLIFINPNQGDGLNGGIPPYTPDPGDENPDPGSFVHGGDLWTWDDYYPYLIITTTEFKPAVRRIAALKRQKGYNVKVVTMDEVMNDPYASQGDCIRQTDGTDTIVYSDSAGVLRQYLKYWYKYHGTKFVLLAGNGVPYRKVPNTYDDHNMTFDIISDLYYSDMNASWDSTRIKDYQPELYVGRILSKNEHQINNYADKLLQYELNPGNGDYSYLKKAFFSRGREFEEYKQATIKSKLLSIFPNQIEINDTKNNNSYYPKGVDIINALNTNRVGFASIHNHSDSAGYRVYGRDKYSRSSYVYAFGELNNGDGLNSLTNKRYPMIFYSPTCVTVPFDYKGLGFGESFTTGSDYGGPVYIGYTRTVIDIATPLIFERFVDEINKGNYQLGVADALSKGIFRWSATSNEILSHAYLGDPELELWTDEPQSFSDIQITRTDNSISISGIDVDTVPTTIAFYSNYGGYRKLQVMTPNATINNALTDRTIVVYKHNYIPYIAPLLLQNLNINDSRYEIVRDVTAGRNIDDKRTPGNVVVQSGVVYELEASGTVMLQDGFMVEKGATFAVYPSSF